ncbi:RNA polymerase sigma-B factor [Nocardioides marinisabuli]|uniref:RNA polymerase sigma-B factor n=1 Tax=Nocardioides marinisabuli TaxID=419476 RepID=A0A7Y9JNM1_9ACTN|nr:sigma-70 family RNA polymerase sigma factor [Nocardioides marinisabuli]NYD56017.1 RNA polymerase sigma-B factor [Nocardioides marinisabuli]
MGVGDSRRRVETARLLLRARVTDGEVRARYENEVVRVNLPVALQVARRYRGRGIADDDLDQVASLGLVKAVRAFDPTLGEDFLGFAVPTLRGEIRRHFRDAGWAVRPPRAVQELQARVARAESRLFQELGRAPRHSEIAVALDVPLSMVTDSLRATGCFAPVSLDAAGDGPGEEPPTARMGGPDPAFASAEARVALAPLLRDLDERELTMVRMRYFEHATQAEIGAAVGLSQEQVSRLLSGLLVRLRRQLADAAA